MTTHPITLFIDRACYIYLLSLLSLFFALDFLTLLFPLRSLFDFMYFLIAVAFELGLKVQKNLMEMSNRFDIDTSYLGLKGALSTGRHKISKDFLTF